MSVANKPALWAISLALAFFVINLTQLGRYGLSYDEPEGMERGRQTVAFVTGLIWPDEGAKLDPGSDWLHHHPSFYATCNYGVSCFLIRWLGWQPIPAGHFLNLLTASAGLVVLFYLGRRLFNARVGLVAVVFMVLFPRFIAHAHFNAKDIPVMVFGTLELWLFHRAVSGDRIRDWILVGLGFALAVTTKLEGLFLLPMMLIPWGIRAWRAGDRLAELAKMEWFLASSVGFIFLLWPELWVDPLRLFRSAVDFSGNFRNLNTGYLGHSYSMHDLPWHYILTSLVSVTPVVWLLAVGVGAVGSLVGLIQRRAGFVHVLLWCWILTPLLPRFLPGVARYDGMRHVFLVVPAMALLAGLAVDQLLSRRLSRPVARLIPVVGCGVVAWSGWQILECHPYEAFYLNEGVRAVIPGPQLPDYFDFYGWGSLNTQGVEWVNAHAPPWSTVALGGDSSRLYHYGLRENLRTLEDVQQADYAVVGCWCGGLLDQFHSPPVFTVRCYDLNLLCVFAKPGREAGEGREKK